MSATEPDVENPERREAMLEAARSEVKEEKEQRRENATTKQWLQGQLDEQTRTVPVMGRDFEFRPLGTDAVADVLDYTPDSVPDGVEAPDDVNPEDLGGMDLGEMPGLLRKVCDLLADACTDEEMDRESWGRVPPDVVERVFEDVAFPGEQSGEGRDTASQESRTQR